LNLRKFQQLKLIKIEDFLTPVFSETASSFETGLNLYIPISQRAIFADRANYAHTTSGLNEKLEIQIRSQYSNFIETLTENVVSNNCNVVTYFIIFLWKIISRKSNKIRRNRAIEC
jgi:hypothetical protein